MRTELRILVGITFVTWIGTRMTQVALPLVALEETGQAWATGLVGGISGLPLLTVGWWGRRLRDRLDSGRAQAVVMAVQAVGLAIVPVSAWAGGVGAWPLAASGLVTGVAGALLGPAQRSLVSDLADASTPAGAPPSAPRWLAWQDLAHRSSMIAAPPLGAWLVTVWGAVPLLWCEVAAVSLGALAVLAVPAAPSSPVPTRASTDEGAPAPSTREEAVDLRGLLRARPRILAGVLMAAVGGMSWFGFSLGLAVLGEQVGRPGQLIGAGMSGYGLASVATALVVPAWAQRLPTVPTMCASWAVLGASFLIAAEASPSLAGIAAASALGGAAMPWAIAALNREISQSTAGAERRAAFMVENVLHSGGTSVGLLVGGAVIGAVGAVPVLIATGAVQIAAAVGGAMAVGRSALT